MHSTVYPAMMFVLQQVGTDLVMLVAMLSKSMHMVRLTKTDWVV